MKSQDPQQLFAITALGLEPVCAGELIAMGMAGVRAVPGGVEFTGGLREVYTANLRLRSASRVVVRVGSVRVRDFPELFQRATRLPWGKFIRPDTAVQVRAVSHRSRLLHTGRIAETVAAAIDRALGRPYPPTVGAQQVLARIEDDLCHLSVDSSGELLHRRGWRQQGGAAPLRETMAAGLLLLLGWDGGVPLVDPLCGSGTLPIEGALLARRLPPGGKRDFAFMTWPGYRPGLWQALLSEVGREARPAPAGILGADHDASAIAMAQGNAERAGVAADLELRQQELVELAAPSTPGLVICNPPYGARLSAGEDLRPLFRQLGDRFRRGFPGWQLAFLATDEELARATALELSPVATFSNGGIRVTLFSTQGR
ncbi:MAG: class I SAM-dependent RNA methyltransferase [Desulfuromonadales bacterium]|nr:class I SAM-dependent RNA methyltransferase [Desulfuromonadales bacterium]